MTNLNRSIYLKSISFLFVLVFLTSCTSTRDTETKIQQKVSLEDSVSDGPSFETRIREVIQSSKTLTDAKKTKLESLLAETRRKNKALLEESFKLRAVLIQELIEAKVDHAQVKQLKKDIKKTESLRVKNSLKLVDEILTVVEGDPSRQAFADQLIYFDRNFH